MICPLNKNKELVKKAEQKIRKSVQLLKSGKPTREGIGILYRLAGFFGQRLYFGYSRLLIRKWYRIMSVRCVTGASIIARSRL